MWWNVTLKYNINFYTVDTWGLILTKSTSRDNLAERPGADLVVWQDAELVGRGGRQTCHLVTGTGRRGHGHREPLLLPVIIPACRPLHPAAPSRHTQAISTKNKRAVENLHQSTFMEHDRKVGFIKHSYSSSALCFRGRDSADVASTLHRTLATPIIWDFHVSSIASFVQTWPEAV